jgi:hypothetical protein
VLGLPAHAQPEEYLVRRTDLGAAEVNHRFLRAGLDDGAWTEHDAERIARQAASGNARRTYRLPSS